MYCFQCGRLIDDGLAACAACGAPATPPMQQGPLAVPPSKPLGEDAAMRMLLPVGRSAWAIIAGYLGLVSVLAVPGPFAVATAIIAFYDIRKHPERHGLGRAIFGLVMGLLGTAVLAIIVWGTVFDRNQPY
jgi:hypothetical protein